MSRIMTTSGTPSKSSGPLAHAPPGNVAVKAFPDIAMLPKRDTQVANTEEARLVISLRDN